MRIFVLGSGSSGNALLVESEGVRILVDAGVSAATCAARLAFLGDALFRIDENGTKRSVDAIVVTHHHGDHIAHLESLARATLAPVYLHAGVAATRVRAKFEVRAYDASVGFEVEGARGRIRVRSLPLPHDAPQVALRFSSARLAFGIATDLGHVTRPLVAMLADCDAAIVEANHCPAMLARGPYPPRLQQRVAGPEGHLANEQTAALAKMLRQTRLSRLYLGHVSERNNTQEKALSVVRSQAGTLPVDILSQRTATAFDVRFSMRPTQLGLGF